MTDRPTKKWPAQIAVDALKREGVTTIFGITGGHISPFQDYAYIGGLEVFHVRHEQAAAHAADGYARITGDVGVCYATAGPGMTNLVTGLHMAYLARSPVVAFIGGHKRSEEGRSGTNQEADVKGVLGSVTKSVKTLTSPEQMDLFIRQAFREARTYPYGPVAIELPLDVYNHAPVAVEDQTAFLVDGHPGRPPRQAVGAETVAKVVDALRSSERPLLLAGDGVHWDGAGQVLREVVEQAEVPVAMRRLARGALDHDHRLVLPPGLRKRAIERADLIVVLGMNMDYFEGFGDWETAAHVVQVTRHPSEVALGLRTEIEVTADSRSFLEALLASTSLEVSPDARDARQQWNGTWSERAAAWRAEREEVASSHSHQQPIHPASFARELALAVPPDVPVLLDGFTAAGHLVDHMRTRGTGNLLDAGLSAAFGHGVGMAIGASAARGSRVVSVLGDGGVGVGGGDIETAARYGVPVVFVIYNNGSLGGGLETYAYGPDFSLLGEKARGGMNVTPEVRYDEMFGLLGLHHALVREVHELGPALKEALEHDGPSVINVIADRHAQPALFETYHSRDMFWHLPIDAVQEQARARHHEHYYPKYHGGRTVSDDLR